MSGKAWLEIAVEAKTRQAEQLEELMFAAGALSVSLLDAKDQPILEPEPGELPLWQDIIVKGLMPDETSIQCFRGMLTGHPALGHLQAIKTELADQIWERAWMEHFKPMSFGHKLWVCPGDDPCPDPDATIVRLDPGLAFGTGTHETTALCLQWLDTHPPDMLDVLDFGSGSGILGIAALKLGARQVMAVDIDPQALTAGKQNAEQNEVSERFKTCYPEQLGNGSYDLIMANILSGPLIELADTLIGHCKTGGRVVLSGILEEQHQEVLARYQPYLINITTSTENGWVRIAGTLKA